MRANEEGIFSGVDESAYHADNEHEIPSLSASLAKILIDQTPAHCFTASQRLNPRFKEKNKSLWDKGKICHKMMLGSDAAIVEVPVEDWRTKEAKKLRDEAYEMKKTPVLYGDLADAREMANAGHRQLEMLETGNPLSHGEPEVVIRWKEEFAVYGKVVSVWCRSRIDWLNRESEDCVDYKSTSASAEPLAWSRHQLFNLGFHYQSAFYRRGLRRLTQLGLLKMHDPNFMFIVQEQADPYLLSVIAPSAESIENADKQVQKAMLTWARCLERKQWPGYAPTVHIVSEPRWYAAQAEAREEHVASEDIARAL